LFCFQSYKENYKLENKSKYGMGIRVDQHSAMLVIHSDLLLF